MNAVLLYRFSYYYYYCCVYYIFINTEYSIRISVQFVTLSTNLLTVYAVLLALKVNGFEFICCCNFRKHPFRFEFVYWQRTNVHTYTQHIHATVEFVSNINKQKRNEIKNRSLSQSDRYRSRKWHENKRRFAIWWMGNRINKMHKTRWNETSAFRSSSSYNDIRLLWMLNRMVYKYYRTLYMA